MQTRTEETLEAIKADLGAIEMDVLTNTTLADLVRAGAQHTEQPVGWGDAEQGTACALSGAGLAAVALGIIEA